MARFVLAAERMVEQLGGLASADDLQRELVTTIPLGDIDAEVAVQLLAEASDSLVWIRGEGALVLADMPYRQTDAIRRELREIAASEPDGLSADDIIARYLNAHLFDEEQSAPDGFVRACLRTADKIERTGGRMHSEAGRTGWRKERIRQALNALGEPQHYGEICSHVNAESPDDQQMTERSVHSCLGLYGETFVRVGRGIYGLVEWGLPDDGSVANAVCRVLAEAGRPLAKEEITQRVLQTWRVGEATVQAALYSDDRVMHVGQGLWQLEE
jgi:DNA-binding phage protein